MIVGVLLLIAICLVVSQVIASDHKKIEEYEKRALPIGLNHAQEECLKKGYDSGVCGKLTASVSTMECSNGYNCWVVYVHKPDASLLATVTVERVDLRAQKLRVTKYSPQP
jgi:hypothetical protein